MSRPDAAAEGRRSVPEGASGKDPRGSAGRQTWAPERPARGLPAPANSRPSGGGRLPPSAAPTSKPPCDRERPSRREIAVATGNGRKPHDRAGEPGYVPRRERLRSGESAFGAELFPPRRNGRNARSSRSARR